MNIFQRIFKEPSTWSSLGTIATAVACVWLTPPVALAIGALIAAPGVALREKGTPPAPAGSP